MEFRRIRELFDGWNSARTTDTDGKHTYLVAMACGGVMENPDIHYENHQYIKANSAKEAVEKYNKLNHCSYYYGTVLQMVD